MSPVAEDMDAVRWHARGDLRVDRIPVPIPGPGQVLVAVEACGLCATDVEEARSGPVAIRKTAVPVAIGHEPVGRVVALGDGVTRPSLGARVVPALAEPCRVCATCRRGAPQDCAEKAVIGFDHDGALAEYVLTTAAQCVAVPDGLAPEVAALTEPCAVAHHAIRVVPDLVGRSAVVVGAGSVGMLAVLWLHHLGVPEITVVEPDDARRKTAVALGAHLAVHPDQFDELLDRLDQTRPWVVLECAGQARSVLTRTNRVPPSSWIVSVGISTGPVECDLLAITLRQHTVRGVNAHDRDLDVVPAVRLLDRHRDVVRDLVETRKSLHTVPALLADGLPSGPAHKLVVIP